MNYITMIAFIIITPMDFFLAGFYHAKQLHYLTLIYCILGLTLIVSALINLFRTRNIDSEIFHK